METIANNVVHVDFRAPRKAAPKNVPFGVLHLIRSESEALAWSIEKAGLKQSEVARLVHKSKGYISKLATGFQPIPHKLVRPLCEATGLNVLQQFIDLQRASDMTEAECRKARAFQLMEAA